MATTEKKETKAEAFKRIANRRVNNALKDIAMIGGLASKTNYDYTDEQVAAILKALAAEVEKLQNKFKNPNSAPDTSFSL